MTTNYRWGDGMTDLTTVSFLEKTENFERHHCIMPAIYWLERSPGTLLQLWNKLSVALLWQTVVLGEDLPSRLRKQDRLGQLTLQQQLNLINRRITSKVEREIQADRRLDPD